MTEKMSAYCLRCKKTVVLENAKIVKTKNGRNMLRGNCSLNNEHVVTQFVKA
jgi:hypothetical protein